MLNFISSFIDLLVFLIFGYDEIRVVFLRFSFKWDWKKGGGEGMVKSKRKFYSE